MVSIWESPESAKLDKALFTFSTLAFMMSSQKEGEPTGHPRRVKSVQVTGISCGRGLLEKLALADMYTSDLVLFRWRPRSDPSSSIICGEIIMGTAEGTGI